MVFKKISMKGLVVMTNEELTDKKIIKITKYTLQHKGEMDV
jgi:hypothetical protein